MAGVLSSTVFHPGCICFLPVGFFLGGCLGGDLDAGLGVCLFFASGVYLSVLLMSSFGGYVFGRGSFCFFIRCRVSVFCVWLGDDDVGSSVRNWLGRGIGRHQGKGKLA